MKINNGLVEIYTGNGKGKTTAAIGLAIRAAGYGLRVYLIHFMKSKRYGESRVLKKFENIKEIYLGKPYFITKDPSIKERFKDVVVFEPGHPPEDYKKLIDNGLKKVRKIIQSCNYDIVILDEIITASYFDLVSIKDLLSIIDEKPNSVELVLTGRYASKELVEKADLVTEMLEIKHPYQKGIEARKGIEF